MNRVFDHSLRRVTVAIVFLCLTTLVMCQLLGPSARLNSLFAPQDPAEQTYVGAAVRTVGAQGHLPARCASIKLVPIEIESASFEPGLVACDLRNAFASIPPHSVELGVPTPPPRAA
ncbi:MAG: hypothetical protein ACOZAM_28815 [Pseudomonadota bacterium]